MGDLSNRNHADMNILRSMVLLVPMTDQVRFAANICGQRLMLGPWWLRGMHWAICKLRGFNPTIAWYLFFKKLERGYPEQVVSGFARHIAYGKDLTDRRSVGGLNQEEVEKTLAILRHVLRGIELPTVYQDVLWPEKADTCSGRDDPDERCPRHPNDCVCWKAS